MESEKYYIFFINTIKLPSNFTREPKTFYFCFDWPKDVDKNLKHEIEFIRKNNESLADNKIINEIEQLLCKYKQGNDMHEHGKQQKEWTT